MGAIHLLSATSGGGSRHRPPEAIVSNNSERSFAVMVEPLLEPIGALGLDVARTVAKKTMVAPDEDQNGERRAP